MRKQKAIIITIPQPCNEAWDAMQPNNCGRFCALCEKTVVDFTEMSDDAIVKIMTRPGQTPCGRFTETQFNRPLVVPDIKPEKPFLRLLSKIAASFLLLQTVFTNAFGQRPYPASATQSSLQKNDAGVPAKDAEYISRIVNGTVTDEHKEPIVGASVKLKGTDAGTQTDLDGNFEINVTGENPELEISYSGYMQQTITITNNNMQYTVCLIKDTVLREVIVATPYGIPVSEQAYTGAADVITVKPITGIPVTDITKAIEGAVPGAQITPGCAIQSDPPSIRIGGSRSVNPSSAPLIILNDKIYKGDITAINPVDVASMQLLKDADATSLYGAKGANGVIVITTKDYKPRKKSGLSRLSGRHPK